MNWRYSGDIPLDVNPRTDSEEEGIIPALSGISQELDDVVEEKDVWATLLSVLPAWNSKSSGKSMDGLNFFAASVSHI